MALWQSLWGDPDRGCHMVLLKPCPRRHHLFCLDLCLTFMRWVFLLRVVGKKEASLLDWAHLGLLLYEFQFWHISKVGFHLKDSKVCLENQSLGPHRSQPNYWTCQSFIFFNYKRWIWTHGVKTHISTMQNSKWIIHFFFEINSSPSKYEWLPILSLWKWTGSERFLIYPKLYRQLDL